MIHKNDVPIPVIKSPNDMNKKECLLINERLLNEEYEMFLRNEISELNSSRLLSDLKIAELIKNTQMNRETVSQKQLIQGTVTEYIEYLLESIHTVGISYEISKAIESELTSNQPEGSKKDIYLQHLKSEVTAEADSKIRSGYKLRDIIKKIHQFEASPQETLIVNKEVISVAANDVNATRNGMLKSGSDLKDITKNPKQFEETPQKPNISKEMYNAKMDCSIPLKPSVFNGLYSAFFPVKLH
jgi:hypothetical protein